MSSLNLLHKKVLNLVDHALQGRHNYHYGELKEPDDVVGDRKSDDEDDKEPSLTHFGRLHGKILALF